MREEMSNIRPFVLASVNNDGESGGRGAVCVRRRVFEPVILFAFSFTNKWFYKKGFVWSEGFRTIFWAIVKNYTNTAEKSGISEK